LRIGKEFNTLRDLLADPALPVRLDLVSHLALGPEELLNVISTEKPAVVHFSGHGVEGGNLLMEGPGGDLVPLSHDLLAKVFRSVNSPPNHRLIRYVVLNACHSEPAAQAISESVDAVIGTQAQIADEAAIAFAREFYGTLAAGRPIGDAIALSKTQLQIEAEIRQASPGGFPGGNVYDPNLVVVHTMRDVYLDRLVLGQAGRTLSFVEADNPYVAGPAVAGKMFVGRRDVLKQIRDNLSPSAGKNILVLRGQRRTGKTSVLLRLRDTLRQESNDSYLPVLVSVQALMMADNTSRFFFQFARRCQLELKRQGVELPLLRPEDFDRDPVDAFEFEFLEQVQAALGSRRVLVMLDEFELVKQLIDQGRLQAEVLDYFRHLMQHTPLLFLVAGTHRLRELTGRYWSVFFNLALFVDIGRLTQADTRWLITQPVRLWYTINSVAQDEIIRLTGCHPYFTQLVCHELVKVRNALRLPQLALAQVREAVQRALKTGTENIGYPWTDEGCGPDERLVLATLARDAADGSPLDEEAARQRLRSAGLSQTFGEAIDQLRVRGVVGRDERGRLVFTVPLFAHWLVQEGYDRPETAARYNEDHPSR
jgi:hypothetical protein